MVFIYQTRFLINLKNNDCKTMNIKLTGKALIAFVICICMTFLFCSCNKKEWVYNVGDEVVFGRYYYEKNDSFRSKSLTWIVIEANEETVTLITKDIIDWTYYSQDEYNIEPSYIWKESDLRIWLNHDFYEKALESDNSLKLINTEQKYYMPDNTEKNYYDKVYLCKEIYVTEAEEWLRAKPTPYAVSQGAVTDKNGYANWWLMPESNDLSLGYVDGNGEIHYGSPGKQDGDFRYEDTCYGVRPVITISQEYWVKVPLGKVNTPA